MATIVTQRLIGRIGDGCGVSDARGLETGRGTTGFLGTSMAQAYGFQPRRLTGFIRQSLTGSRKGIEDVLVSMVPQLVSVLAGFVTSILLARGLGPGTLGSYTLVMSVAGLTGPLSDLGIGQTAIRFASLAAARDDRNGHLAILRWAFRLRILLVFAISLVAFVAAAHIARSFWSEERLGPLVRLSLLIGIFSAIAGVPTIYFQSLKRFRMNALVALGQTLVSLLGIALLATFKKWSLEAVIMVSIVASGLGALTFLLLIPRKALFSPGEWTQPLRQIVRAPATSGNMRSRLDDTGANEFAFLMVVSSLMVTLTMRADVWLLGHYLEKGQVGLYSVASRFTLPLTIVLGALNTALWPRASALRDLSGIAQMIRRTSRLSILVACVGLAYSVAAPIAIPYVFGPTYAGSVRLAQVLCVRYCLSILICPLGVIGYSFGLVRVAWWINALQLATVFGLNVLLLPRISAMGSALALIGSEMMGLVLFGCIIWRKFLAMREDRLA